MVAVLLCPARFAGECEGLRRTAWRPTRDVSNIAREMNREEGSLVAQFMLLRNRETQRRSVEGQPRSGGTEPCLAAENKSSGMKRNDLRWSCGPLKS